MGSEESGVYGYRQVADRIEQELGVRPSTSTLRAAVASPRPSSTNRRPRITTGMPAPLPTSYPRTFSAQAIDDWLAQHPWRGREEACRRAREQLSAGTDEEDAVRTLVHADVSWQEIADVLGEHRGSPISKSAVHKRFGHLAAS